MLMPGVTLADSAMIFKVVFAGFGVGHTNNVPAEVVAFVGAQCRAPAADGDPVRAFFSHEVVAKTCNVSVHFGVWFADNS